MKQKILFRGAEAIIYCKEKSQATYQSFAEALSNERKFFVVKKRVKKSYRIFEIDNKIRKLRTRNEAKLILRASKVISVPKISKVSEVSKEIIMEFIDGKKLSEYLNNFDLKEQKNIARKIGGCVSKLHDANIIHGDLTTSNMILKTMKSDVGNQMSENIGRKSKIKQTKTELYFIDFGLGFYSTKIEDRAVDLYLLKQALEAKHFENFKILFGEVIKNYKSKDKDKILVRLEKVEKRRRYK